MSTAKGGIVTVNDSSKITKDISALYLSEKFSDITLIVDEERIPAHKVILAARSSYFEDLLYDGGEEIEQSELRLQLSTSPDVFKDILKFLYTGIIVINPLKVKPTLEVMILAHQGSLSELEQAIVKELKSLLNLKNICSVFNTANEHNLSDLRDACLSFMDQHSSEILANKCFKDFTEKSLIKLLERDTFFAPELEIFKKVSEWCQENNDVKDLVLKCVRLSWLTVEDIVSIVWPRKLNSCDDLLQAIAEIVEVRPQTTNPRGKLLKDVNVATPQLKAIGLTGTIRQSNLLTGNRDINAYAHCNVNDKDGFTFKLGSPTFINHIHMQLYDGDLRTYKYYIELSVDRKTWKRVIDYQNYPCRSVQKCFFEEEIAQYVRIVGTYNSANTDFHLIYVEMYYKSSIPRVINGVVVPTTNVATVAEKAVVIAGTNGNALLDGITSNYSNFTWHKIGAGNIVVQLAQPFMLSSMKLLLWDNDKRTYKYYIEVSTNKSDWTVIADHRNEESRSWQLLRFLETPVIFIRITGTSNSVNTNNDFHLLHFECPACETPLKTY